jgi:hypothetical protein
MKRGGNSGLHFADAFETEEIILWLTTARYRRRLAIRTRLLKGPLIRLPLIRQLLKRRSRNELKRQLTQIGCGRSFEMI